MLPGEMPEGGASREMEIGDAYSVVHFLSSVQKTAEGADFSSLNWHS